jgi:FkbM family methyltransferase
VRAIVRATAWQLRKRLRPVPRDVAFAGMVLRCYPDSASASNVHYFTERFDWDQMGFLARYLRPGDGFLDVGANIGTYTLLAASLVGPGGSVTAIEPLPEACRRLRENLARNGLDAVVVHEVAVDERDGEVGFLDFDVSSSIDHDTDRRGREPFVVPCRRIDALVPAGHLAAAKLDVEGVELRALRGAEGLVARHDPPVWLVELMDWQLVKHGDTAAGLVAWMDDHGFGPHRFDADAGELRDLAGRWADHDDVLFIARDRLDEVRARLAQAEPLPRHR